MPVHAPDIPAPDLSLSDSLQNDCVCCGWLAVRVAVAPLPDLRLALRDTARNELLGAERAGLAEVFIECHAPILEHLLQPSQAQSLP